MDWLKQNWLKLVREYRFLLIFVAIILVLVLFVFDIGINSNYFIRRNFNNAFMLRVTGDCQAFREYTNVSQDAWLQRCESEKKRSTMPIKSFHVLRISHSFFSNKAFIQVELTKDNIETGKVLTYTASYDLKKVGMTWKINDFK